MSYSVKTETVTATAVVVPEYINDIAASLVSISEKGMALFRKIPGAEILISYIKYSYQDDPYRSVFELLLFIFAIRYFLKSKSSYSKKDYVKLSDKEVDELVLDWQPDPIVQPVDEKEQWQLQAYPILKGKCAPHSKVIDRKTGEAKPVINLASLNFLNIAAHPKMISSGIDQISYSGVGACGPPNFYGTQDSHRRLEEDLAEYFQTESAILYAQDFMTSQSIIPCFLKRGDIAVVDGGVGLALQKAIQISRCDVYWYDHNDMESLEAVLKDLTKALKDEEVTRRFIITELLFDNYGDLPDLAKIVEIKKKYKFRLILEESRSLGVLGKTGRGLVEHCGVNRSDVDVTIGSLAQLFGSSGGFCIGTGPMIDYQKLQSNAYVFSASLPPYCAKIGSTALKLLAESDKKSGESTLATNLQSNTAKFYKLISSNRSVTKYFDLLSAPESPTIHLRLNPQLRKSLNLPPSYGGLNSKMLKKGNQEDYFDAHYNYENHILQIIIDKLVDAGVLIARSQRILHHEILPMIPELLININAGLTSEDIQTSVGTIGKKIDEVLAKPKFSFTV